MDIESIMDEFTYDNWDALSLIAFKIRSNFDPNNTTPAKYREYQAAVMLTRLANAAMSETVPMTLDEADANLTPPTEQGE
jgi:hypothetical protein